MPKVNVMRVNKDTNEPFVWTTWELKTEALTAAFMDGVRAAQGAECYAERVKDDMGLQADKE